MPRTKKKESKQKSVAIQTDNIDSNVEVVRLQEQLKMLQLENDTLKKSVNINTVSVEDFPDKSRLSSVQTPQRVNKNQKGNGQILRSATKPKMCTCKGNCSNKICGCVKNERKCGSMCKCDDQNCQNQELENKENMPDISNEIVYKAKQLESVQNLFSPEGTENEINLNNIKFEDIHFGTPKKSMYASNQELENKNKIKVRNDLIKGRNKDKKENEGVGDKKHVTTSKQTMKVKIIKTSANKNNENKAQEPATIESEVIQKSPLSEEDDTNSIPEAEKSFDPMKPKRQLLRTPPRGNVEYEPLNVSTPVATPTAIETVTAIETSIENTEQKMDTIPEELNKENVDLDKLSIELVSCKKCKRNFYPWRIEVHEDVCLGS